MTKGINIKFVFGGLDWLYAQGIVDAGTQNEIDMRLATYGRVANDPTKCRMKNVLGMPVNGSINDFQQLAGDGFDFARLMIEPFALGATASNPVVDTTAPGFDALKDTIGEAYNSGCKLVLAMYPDAFSENQYIKHFRDGINDDDEDPVADWPGPYGHQFCWRDDAPTTFQPSSSHPLRVFWVSLVQALKSPLTGVSTDQFNALSFDLCDEPLGVISAVGAVDTTVTQHILGQVSWLNRWINAAHNWRKLQLNAIVGIQAEAPTATILVNSYDAFPESYIAYTSKTPINRTLFPIAPTSYKSNECNISNLIYKAHIFEPFRYTHSKNDGYAMWKDKYNESRDFFGVDDNPNDEYPVPESISQYQALAGDVAEALGWLHAWRLLNGNVKMLVTGFGVNELNRQSDNPISPPPLEADPPGPVAFTPSLRKAEWLEDVRGALQSDNIGWTVFEYLGGFATYQGELNPNWKLLYYRRTTHPRYMEPLYKTALF